MTKGKPWPVEDERKLRNQAKAGLDLDDLVASFGSKYTKNAVYQKITDLGLKKTKTKIHDVPPLFQERETDTAQRAAEHGGITKNAQSSIGCPAIVQADSNRCHKTTLSHSSREDLPRAISKIREIS